MGPGSGLFLDFVISIMNHTRHKVVIVTGAEQSPQKLARLYLDGVNPYNPKEKLDLPIIYAIGRAKRDAVREAGYDLDNTIWIDNDPATITGEAFLKACDDAKL